MLPLETFWETLKTGSGFWNPVVWVVAIVIIFLLVYILRGFGKKEYKKETKQTQAFLSGNPEYEKEDMHVKGSNMYWGFTETLKSVYNVLKRMHNGNASDYVLWFLIILAVLFVFVGLI